MSESDRQPGPDPRQSRMERKGRQVVTAFQDKFYYDYPSYKKEERRDGRQKIRRSDSGRSRREVSRSRDKERPNNGHREGSVKRHRDNWSQQTRSERDNWSHQVKSERDNWSHQVKSERDNWSHQVRSERDTTDRRRWAWATTGDFDIINRNQQQSFKAKNDYVDMSSMDTSSSSSDSSSVTAFSPQSRPGRSQGLGYHKIYVRHPQAISRSRSTSRPSPPRAKSVGNFPIQPSRAQSFTSIYSSKSVDHRPLRTSLSSHGIFFTETGHLPRYPSTMEAPLSMSLQDLQSSR